MFCFLTKAALRSSVMTAAIGLASIGARAQVVDSGAEPELFARPVGLKELMQSGSQYHGKMVFVEGFLFVDNGLRLTASIEDFTAIGNPDRYVAIYPRVEENLDSFSGCYVAVVGTVTNQRYSEDLVALTDVAFIKRTGMLYLLSKEKMNHDNVDAEPKCEIDAIVDSMADIQGP
ncbi:hypothetical protein F6455_04330 [Proteobacteria bacterium 005FR1]|nr:hypothetical protein [Proteobacteria bacterium 005FR1]